MAKKQSSGGSKQSSGGGKSSANKVKATTKGQKAKENKKKTKAAAASLPPERAAAAAFIKQLDATLDRGNYTSIRSQALAAPSDLTSDEQIAIRDRRALVDIDLTQVAVGGFAILCVLVVAALTLITH